MKRGSPKRDWSEVTIDAQTPCRVCGIEGRTERAHVAPRKHDARKGKGRKVNPDSVVPLCGPALDPQSCHYRFDHGELDLLPHLTLAEQLRAVEDLGGIELARKRTAPSDYHRAIRAARESVLEAA